LIGRPLRLIALLFALLLLAAACGNGGDTAAPTQPDTTPAEDQPAPDPDDDDAPADGDLTVPDNPQQGVTSDAITFGWMGDATGPTAAAQALNLRGMQAAVRYYNEQGGVLGRQLRLVDRDDQFAAETAVSNYDALLNDDRILALLGMGGAHISAALMENLDRDGLPLIGPPQTIDPQLDHDWVFNNIAHYSDQADVAVELMGRQVGSIEDVVMAVIQLELPSGDEWNVYTRNRLEERGGTYVDRILLSPGSPDYPGSVQRLQQLVNSDGVNYLALHGAPSHGLGVVTEMSRLGLEIPIVGIHGIAGTTIYEEGPQDMLDLIRGIHSFTPATSECELCSVIRDYTAGTQWADDTDHINFSHGWLNVYIAIQALERAAEQSGEITRETLRDALRGQFDTGGLSCPIDWSASNHSPCAAPWEWLGDRLEAVDGFEAWADVFQQQYHLS
jgi:branched-chain amino acid transport system substrate-binding protein